MFVSGIFLLWVQVSREEGQRRSCPYTLCLALCEPWRKSVYRLREWALKKSQKEGGEPLQTQDLPGKLILRAESQDDRQGRCIPTCRTTVCAPICSDS